MSLDTWAQSATCVIFMVVFAAKTAGSQKVTFKQNMCYGLNLLNIVWVLHGNKVNTVLHSGLTSIGPFYTTERRKYININSFSTGVFGFNVLQYTVQGLYYYTVYFKYCPTFVLWWTGIPFRVYVCFIHGFPGICSGSLVRLTRMKWSLKTNV